MDYAARYLQKQEAFLSKWVAFRADDLGMGFKPLEFSSAIPTAGSTWSLPEQEKYFYLFCLFNCEALVLFEQCIMYGQKRVLKNNIEESERNAFQHFVREEFIHSQAFRKYMRKETKFNFPGQSLLLHRCHRLKNLLALVMRIEPLSIFIPGAKSETYSIFYARLFTKVFGTDGNTYAKLQHIHSLDEGHHVPFDYQFITSVLSKKTFIGQCRVLICTLMMIGLVQFIVLLGSYGMLKQLRPRQGFLRTVLQMFQIFRWTMFHFPPYVQTRMQMRNVYRQQRAFLFRFFKVVPL